MSRPEPTRSSPCEGVKMTEDLAVRATTEVNPFQGSRFSRTNRAVTYVVPSQATPLGAWFAIRPLLQQRRDPPAVRGRMGGPVRSR
jgi:hypothetical protein